MKLMDIDDPQMILSIAYFIICGTYGLFLHNKMLKILKERGVKISFFWNNPMHYFRFWDIISEEKVLRKKVKYQFILWGQFALIPVYLIGMMFILR